MAVVQKRVDSFSEKIFLPAIFEGIVITARQFFKNLLSKEKDITTLSYPDEKEVYAHHHRGIHRLVPREDGSPRCVACMLCSTACPALCIHIEAADSLNAHKEKFPAVFNIDELRCIACGLCVEACPCDAIRMDTGLHPPPSFTREEQVYTLDKLLSFKGRYEPEKRNLQSGPTTAGGTARAKFIPQKNYEPNDSVPVITKVDEVRE